MIRRQRADVLHIDDVSIGCIIIAHVFQRRREFGLRFRSQRVHAELEIERIVVVVVVVHLSRFFACVRACLSRKRERQRERESDSREQKNDEEEEEKSEQKVPLSFVD